MNQHKLLPQDPVFLTSKGYVINQSQVRKALSAIIEIIQLPRGSLTFHDFRRSGATWALNHNVEMQNLQVHEGWKSQAVWSYLKNTTMAAGVVAKAFQQSLSTL